MDKASVDDRNYFSRVASQNAALSREQVPASLDEMFERLEELKRQLGMLAVPGRTEFHCRGDLDSHLEMLRRFRSIDDADRA